MPKSIFSLKNLQLKKHTVNRYSQKHNVTDAKQHFSGQSR